MNKRRLLGIFIFFIQAMVLHQNINGVSNAQKKNRKTKAIKNIGQGAKKENIKETQGKREAEGEAWQGRQIEQGKAEQELQNQAEDLTVTADKDSDAPAKSEDQGEDGGEREITRVRDLKLSDIKYDSSEMKQVLGAGGGMTTMAGLQMALGELIGTAPSGTKDPKADSWKKEELNITSKDLMVREPKGKVAQSSESSTNQAEEASAKTENAAPTEQWFSGEKDPEEIKARARAEGVYQSMPFEAFEGGQ